MEHPHSYRLEGEEDLDVLDEHGHILYAIQVKNLSRTLSLSDLIAQHKTSFLKRFVDIYPKSTPILVSFGQVHEDLKKWKDKPNDKVPKEWALFQKAGISEAEIALIKDKVLFKEVSEETITEKILALLSAHKSIDPVPTAENLLYYIQYTAEKQQLISTRDLLERIDKIGIYLSERIAYTNQYGIFIKPLIKTELSQTDAEKYKSEFYYGISARYEHINLDLDVKREKFLQSIDKALAKHNVAVISGASGQGKSTLAYRYVSNKASDSLIYEIDLQQDPVKINEAINAIAGITKNLKVPIYFILHVTPNTTSWLRVAREFASHPFLRLLVTIRNEDWFRAQSSEIDFLHNNIELELAETEAEIIFNRLENRQLVRTHNDFKDAWVAFTGEVPLLEFIHAITQGSSLRDKLSAQVMQLTNEEAEKPIGQLELLRILCLADAFGARIDVSLIRDIPNIKLVIDKFEKEYLLKHSNDRKYMSGLHPIRSILLLELLFDEFVICKKDYIGSCLKVIDQEDAYSFLLQTLYHRIQSPGDLIDDLKNSKRNTWTIYGAAAKSMLWAGIRSYIDDNGALIREVQEKCGDSWSVVTDIYHGEVVDLDDVLGSMFGGNPAFVEYLRDIKARLSPKSEVYSPIVQLFDQAPLPPAPKNYSDWQNFAETLFWLGQTNNRAAKIRDLKIEDFKDAFHLLDTQPLALLMLGMHYYSERFNEIRLKLAPIFNDRVRAEFQIPLMEISKEVSLDFVINMTKEDQTIGWHELTIGIINLLRTAYPEKTAFKSQGHGHRLDMLPAFHDETIKHIPSKSLPLANWVNINSNLIALIDFPGKPDDWFDFHQQLQAWEKQIKEILQVFFRSFQTFRRVNDLSVLDSVFHQANYRSLTKITAPKNTVDPLGIPVSYKSPLAKSKKDPGETDSKESYYSKKYETFLKAYNDYKSAIETFVLQSGKACYDGAKGVIDNEHTPDAHLLDLTYVNLNRAVEKRAKFYVQREKYFKKFNSNNTEISDEDLFLTATVWKGFWKAIQTRDLKRIAQTENITNLKNDFIQALSKAIKATNRNSDFSISYRNDASTSDLPVFITNVTDPLQSIFALRECYNIIFQCIKGTEASGLKHLMLKRYFPEFYIISEMRGKIFDFKWHEFPLHLFRDTPFEELKPFRFVTQYIDPIIVSNLKLKSWMLIHPDVKIIIDTATEFEKLKLYIAHLTDLKFFNENKKLDKIGDDLIKKHVEETGRLIMEIWNNLLERLEKLSGEFPEDINEIHSEEAQEYWASMLDVIAVLTPKKTELDKGFFDMESLHSWSDRLAKLSERWNMFMMLLQKKVIMEHEI